jgi:hypothetical protein
MLRSRKTTAAIPLALASLALAACGSAASGTVSAKRATTVARWTAAVHLRRPLDVAVRANGSVVVAADGRLFLLGRSGALTRFAPAYTSPGGEEPYIAAPGAAQGGSFGRNAVYAIRLQQGRGITRIAANGSVTRFANITAPGLIDGIAFDSAGGFGYGLVVTINHGTTSTVDVIDGHGAVTTITRSAPRVEGGIAVAPASFGRYAGNLIAPDETGGRLFAITPNGGSKFLANSGLPHGGDIGVESEAFVPSNQNYKALVADRFTPGNRHPGDDVLLTVSSAALSAAGVRPGDLLVTTEGGALTDAVTCGGVKCSVRYVAAGPAVAHGEGHIVFIPR